MKLHKEAKQKYIFFIYLVSIQIKKDKKNIHTKITLGNNKKIVLENIDNISYSSELFHTIKINL